MFEFPKEVREGAAESTGAFLPYRLTDAGAEQYYRKRVMSLTFEVSELRRQLCHTQDALLLAQHEQSLLRSSASFRIVHGMQSRMQRLVPANSRRGRLFAYCRRGAVLWIKQGSLAALRKIFSKLTSRVRRLGRGTEEVGDPEIEAVLPPKSEYQEWIEMVEPRELAEAAHHAGSLAYRPLISIVMPAYNVDRNLLQAAIQSVKEQFYDNWELCICDDGSTNPDVRPTLLEAARQDPRIKVDYAEENRGIAVASNRALALASGEFMALLDADDQLTPHALYQVAKLLNVHSDADVIYSDEDKVDMTGRRYDPFLKPDWSPDLMRSCNYLCHLTVLRTSRVREVGGFRPGMEGSQDYDLFLRLLEKTKTIHHIPKVLYHWRACPSSTASAPAVKMHAHVAARVALQEHLQRCGIAAKVTEGCALGRWRIQYKIQGDPRVCIVLPTGGNLDLLDQCIKSIVGITDYRNYEFLIIDNSKDEHVQTYLPTVAKLWPRSRCLDRRGMPFNFSALNNQAVNIADAPLVLFLNDDTVPINAEWLEAMVEHAQRPEVGAVGCKLLYASGDIQHAGVAMGIADNCDHVFKHMSGDPSRTGYFDLPHIIRNVSAVTGACLMTRRDVFREVGGFEELHLPVAFQDIDFCLKLRAKGYLNIYTPHARLYHLECQTKVEKVPNPAEVGYMHRQWGHVIAHDPYYHPNLTRMRTDCSLELLDIRLHALGRTSTASSIVARAA
jgi:GT2 family glycosyltransferase